jgi:predicted nucleotidyltransferase
MNLASSEKEKIIEICKRNDISYCALFGSFARGEAIKGNVLKDLKVIYEEAK